jgi:signal transduction histidine kinase
MMGKKIEFPKQIDLNRFISEQAHDLRTPFNHITGFSKMLLNTMGDGPITDIQKEDLGTVYRSGMRALSLINNLIDIARINQLEKEPNPKDVDIEQLVAQGLAQWKKFFPGVDIQTDYQILTHQRIIHADEQMVRQIVSGFIAFVALFCEAKASITISVDEQSDWFLFTFTSSGKSIHPPSELDRDMIGFINFNYLMLQKGEIQLAEQTDAGAIIQFVLPKTG